MSADFWAGYLSGAAGIVIGNPLDLLKTRLQASSGASIAQRNFESVGTLVRGAPAPILGYGALNAILFATYNRSLSLISQQPLSPSLPSQCSLAAVWLSGAIGGFATFVVSAPTELVKCRAQVWSHSNALPNSISSKRVSSYGISREIWRNEGLRGFFRGGVVTSIRDAVGYGFYFSTYELCKRHWPTSDTDTKPMEETPTKILVCGGIAGVATWASIFPLDVLKTRVQTQNPSADDALRPVKSSLHLARQIFQEEGSAAFYRGLGICSVRAFFVNAAQWWIYEWAFSVLDRRSGGRTVMEG